MSRTIPSGILTAIGQDQIEPFYAVEMSFDTAPVRLWTGYGDRTIDGQTYIGTGALLQISGLDEVADMSAKAVTITLSGLDTSLISLALSEPYQRRYCRVLFGVVGVSDFIEVFGGEMNQMTTDEDGQTATISLMVDSRTVEFQRSKTLRYTHESQQAYFPGDTFFAYVSDLQDKEFAWGGQVDNRQRLVASTSR